MQGVIDTRPEWNSSRYMDSWTVRVKMNVLITMEGGGEIPNCPTLVGEISSIIPIDCGIYSPRRFGTLTEGKV